MDPRSFTQSLSDNVIQPFILLFFALGFLIFVYGIVEYVWGLSTDTLAKENGKKHMLWGVIGMFIMAGAYGIFNLMVDLIGAPVGVDTIWRD